MTGHEQYAEDLTLHVLGVLDKEDIHTLEEHISSCSSCRRELLQLQDDAAWLALSTIGPVPPARARKRLLESIAREPRIPRIVQKRAFWAMAIPYGLAAALALLTVFFRSEIFDLRRRMTNLQSSYSAQQHELAQARDLVNTFTSAEAKHITLVAANASPQPQGKAFYLRTTGRLVFLASNMAPVSTARAYELWLIPETGAPIPAGTFKPDAHGSAVIVNPPLPRGVEAKAFAVTVEPEAGSAAPTTQPIMIGAGE